MAEFPERISIYLQRAPKAGLFAAVSDELPGLMTVAENIEEIERRLSDDIKRLIKAQYGEDIEVILEDDDSGSDFVSLCDPRIAELRAA